MKSVGDFLRGKIRRSELTGLRLGPPGPPHPALGAHQGDLEPGGEALRFFERGIVLPDGAALPYAAIAAIEAEPLRVIPEQGAPVEVPMGEDAARVAFAALRWVGRAQLRRRLD